MRENRKPKKERPKHNNLPVPKEEIKPYIPEAPYKQDKNRPGCGC